MGEDATEAALELTILSAEGLHYTAFLGKSKPFAVAWVDPCFKKSTKNLNLDLTSSRSRNPSSTQKLHFPLSPLALQNPTSSLTLQILASRLPFQSTKLIGTATVPLSSVQMAGDILTLQLRKKPCGRVHGTVRASLRLLWCLGVPDLPPFSAPTAPPLPDGCGGAGFLCVDMMSSPVTDGCSGGDEVCADLMSPPPPPDEDSFSSSSSSSGSLSVDWKGPEDCGQIAPRIMEDERVGRPVAEGNDACKSFLIGLASGTLALVLMGTADFSEV